MKNLSISLGLFFIALTGLSQKDNHPPIELKAATDFYTVAPFWLNNIPIKANDTSGYGNDFFKGIKFVVKTDIDSVVIPFDPSKKPYTQTSWIRIASPSKSQLIAINYWEIRAEFSPEYIRRNTNKVQFDTPETYELANILYALTLSSNADENRTFKESAYYKRVLAYFKPFIGHPLLKQLEFGNDVDGINSYYNFRENSFCFRFENDRVVRNNQYNVVVGNMKDNLFEKLLPLINDFAEKSRFRKFYAGNKEYYKAQIMQAAEMTPVKKMWSWLENNFSGQFQSYRVVFSPLIKGSHSTQQFRWLEKINKIFSEAVMFTAGPALFEKDSTLTNTKKEGLASGIVFTEIDHNYINPASFRYRKRIDSAFQNIDNWLLKEGDSRLYQSPEAVFNEYMTHAAYILYAYDNFSAADFQFIKAQREDLMVKRRKYFRFKEFVATLLDLYIGKPKETKLENLYNGILDWAASQ